MLNNALVLPSGQASSSAGGKAVAGDHVAVSDADAAVFGGGGVGVVVSDANAVSAGFTGGQFEMAGVLSLGVAGGVPTTGFAAGDVTGFTVTAGLGGVDVNVDHIGGNLLGDNVALGHDLTMIDDGGPMLF